MPSINHSFETEALPAGVDNDLYTFGGMLSLLKGLVWATDLAGPGLLCTPNQYLLTLHDEIKYSIGQGDGALTLLVSSSRCVQFCPEVSSVTLRAALQKSALSREEGEQ